MAAEEWLQIASRKKGVSLLNMSKSTYIFFPHILFCFISCVNTLCSFDTYILLLVELSFAGSKYRGLEEIPAWLFCLADDN